MTKVRAAGFEALFAGLDLRELGFRVVERAATDAATHPVLAR